MKICNIYRHRPFRVDGACLICNADPRLAELLEKNEQLEGFYMASLVGRECHALGCWTAGVSHDSLGHWWCESHQAQRRFLVLGVERDFPTLNKYLLRPGRSAWYSRAMAEKPEKLDQICEELKLAGSVVVAK